MIRKSSLALCGAVLTLAAASASAKIPAPPLTDEAKAKAAEVAAKTAWSNSVANFQLCKSMERTAAAYFAQAKKDGKAVKPADASATPCTDPGPFVYKPPVAASAPAAVAAAAPPPAAPAPKKK